MICTEDISNKSELETEENASLNLNCEATNLDKTDQISKLSLYFDNNKNLLFDNVFEDQNSIEDYICALNSNEEKVKQNCLSLPEIESNDEVIDSKNIYASSKVYMPKLENTRQKIPSLSGCSNEVISEKLNQKMLVDKSVPIDLNHDTSNASCTLENEISSEPFAIGYTGRNSARISIQYSLSSLQEISQNSNHNSSSPTTNHHSAVSSSEKPNFSKSKLKVGHLPESLSKSQKSFTLSVKGKNKTRKMKSSSIANLDSFDNEMLENDQNTSSEEFQKSNPDDFPCKANNDGKGNKQFKKAGRNKTGVKLKYSGSNEIKLGKQLRVSLTDLFASKSKEDYKNLLQHKTSNYSASATDSKNAVSNLKDEINHETTLQGSCKKTINKQTKTTSNSTFSSKKMLHKEKVPNQSACLSNPVISNIQQISLKEFNSASDTESTPVIKPSLLERKVKSTNVNRKEALKALCKSVSVNGTDCTLNESENNCKNLKIEKVKPVTKQSAFMQLVSKFVDNKPENSQMKTLPARQDFFNFLSNSTKKNPDVSSKEKNCKEQVTPSSKRGKKRKLEDVSLAVDDNPCCSKSLNLNSIHVQKSEISENHPVTKIISIAEIHVPPKSSCKSSLSPKKLRRTSKDAIQNSLKSILDEHLLPVSMPSESARNGKRISLDSTTDENKKKEEEDKNSSESIERGTSSSRESKSGKKNNSVRNRLPVKSSKSQNYMTNNIQISVNRLELSQQFKDDICDKSPLKSSNCVSSTRFANAINKKPMSNVDVTLNAFDTQSLYSNIPESSDDNISPTKEQSKRGKKNRLAAKNQLKEESVLHSPCSRSSDSKRKPVKTNLKDNKSDADAFDTKLFNSNIPDCLENFSPSKSKSKLTRENNPLDENLKPETPILFSRFSHRLRSKRSSMETQSGKNHSWDVNADTSEAESFINVSKNPEDISLVQEKLKPGKKKKLPVSSPLETSILFPCAQLSSKRNKSSKKNLKYGRKSKDRFHDNSPLSISSSEVYKNSITSDAIRSKLNQSDLSEKEIDFEELFGESPRGKRGEMKAEKSSNTSRVVSDSLKSPNNNSYHKTANAKKSNQENNKKYTDRKNIKIKDIISKSKNFVENSENSSYIKNNSTQSKSLKNLTKNKESRSNVSIKRSGSSGCDAEEFVKIKKDISSPHTDAHHDSKFFSDSSEVDDFFVDSDSGWPTQDAEILNDDLEPKTPKVSLKHRTNSLKATKFLKADDSLENLRKTAKHNSHAEQIPRKSVRMKKRNARYSLDEKAQLRSISPARQNIKFKPSLEKDEGNILSSFNANLSPNRASTDNHTTTVATVNNSYFPNQNSMVNNAASNASMSYAVPAYVFPSSNTLVVSLPPSISFNPSHVNSSNQFISHLQASQRPMYNPSNMITQFNSPSTSQGVSYPFYQSTPLSYPANIQGNNLFNSNITAQTQSPFQRPSDIMVVNSDSVSKSQFLSPGNFNITQSTPVMNVQNMSNYNSSKLKSKPQKRIVKTIERIKQQSDKILNTISFPVNSCETQSSSSTVFEPCSNQLSKHFAAHGHQNNPESLVNVQQNEGAVVKDIVSGLVMWDDVMHNLTGFTCMQRMSEFTASVFSDVDFNEFQTVRDYFSNEENLNMLSSKVKVHNFDNPCQVMYRFPEKFLQAPVRQIIKDYVSCHVQHLLNVTNFEELMKEVYQKFSLKDCIYLSSIMPVEAAKKEVSLKILVEYFTFVAILRIYDEYKKRVKLH